MSEARFNPTSTSGIGFKLEHYVQASYLISLITESPIPFSDGLLIKEISFQAKQKADTDDLIVVLSNEFRTETHYIQSKKGFGVSESPTFYEVIDNCYTDFKKDSFKKDDNKLIVVTDILGKADIADGQTILEWARFSSSVEDFHEKLKDNKKKKNKYLLFVKGLERANGGQIESSSVWAFLKCFHIKSFDYLESGSKDLATLGWYLKPFLKSGLSHEHTLKTLISYIEECNQNAATQNSSNIKESIKDLFELEQLPKLRGQLLDLLKKSKSQLNHTIHNNIDGFHFERKEYLQRLTESTVSEGFIVLSGDAGLGKSALVKDFIESVFNAELGFIYFKADQLDRSSLAQALSDIGISLDFETIVSQWINLPRLIIYIDSFEKLYESDNKEAMLELLGIIKKFNNVTIIASSRAYAVETLRIKYRIPKEVFLTIPVLPLTPEDLQIISAAKPSLTNLIKNPKLNRLISIPFYLNQAIQIVSNISNEDMIDEISFKNAIWEKVIERKGDGKAGHSSLRAKTFSKITIKRAIEKQAFIDLENDADLNIVEELRNENILIKHPNLDLYAGAHDIFEDIAVVRHLMQEFQLKENSKKFIESLDTNPVFRRGIRLWIQDLLFTEPEAAKLFLKEIIPLNSKGTPITDEISIGILGSSNCYEILNQNKDLFLVNNAKLFIKLFRLCKVVYTVPVETEYPNIKHKTIGPGWNALLKFLDENYSTNEQGFSIVISDLLNSWSLQFDFHEKIPVEGTTVSKYCILLLKQGKNDFGFEPNKVLLEILFRVAPADQESIFQFLKIAIDFQKVSSDRYDSRIRSYDKLFEMLLEKTYRCVRVYELFPDLIIELAKIEWFTNELPERYSSDYNEKSFGLTGYPYDYFSASSNQTPFKYLLRYHPEKAIKFLIDLTNRGVIIYLKTDHNTKIQEIKIELEDGSISKQFGSNELWSAYRGLTSLPYLIQSALMALEEYMLEEATKGENLASMFDLIMRNSNSVLLTSVLASVAMEYPLIFESKIFLLLKVKVFFSWDLSRYSQEYTTSHTTIGNDPYYTRERILSNQLNHRKYNLESLVSRLQLFNPAPINQIIDDHLNKSEKIDKLWRLALARMDMRDSEPEIDNERDLVILKPKPLAQDLQEVVDDGDSNRKKDSNSIALFLWTQKALKKENDIAPTIEKWRESYSQLSEIDHQRNFLPGNLEKQIAALGVRDFLEHLSDDERDFCIKTILSDIDNPLNRLKLGYSYASTLDLDKSVIEILPLLVKPEFLHSIDNNQIKKLIIEFLILLPNDLKAILIKSIRDNLWSIDSDFANTCFQTLIKLSHDQTILSTFRSIRNEDPDQYIKSINSVLDEFKETDEIVVTEIDLKVCQMSSLIDALNTVPHSLLDGKYKLHLDEILNQISSLESFNDYKNSSFKSRFEKLLAYYLIDIASPSSQEILLTIITMTNKRDFSMNVLDWMTAIGHDRKYPQQLKEHLSTILIYVVKYNARIGLIRFLLFESLTDPENAFKLPIDGEIKSIHERIVTGFGADKNLIDAIFKLLSGIGSIYQPMCLTWLMKSLPSKEHYDIIVNNQTVNYLEKFVLQMYEYHLPHLQRNREQMDYLILILNVLVENGSTSAFRLRDEII